MCICVVLRRRSLKWSLQGCVWSPAVWQVWDAVHCCSISRQYCTRPGLPDHEEHATPRWILPPQQQLINCSTTRAAPDCRCIFNTSVSIWHSGYVRNEIVAYWLNIVQYALYTVYLFFHCIMGYSILHRVLWCLLSNKASVFR